MMANDAAFESALGSAAAATAARFKQWGQPVATGNDTAVDVSACIVHSVVCHLRVLTILLLSLRTGKRQMEGFQNGLGNLLCMIPAETC